MEIVILCIACVSLIAFAALLMAFDACGQVRKLRKRIEAMENTPVVSFDDDDLAPKTMGEYAKHMSNTIAKS